MKKPIPRKKSDKDGDEAMKTTSKKVVKQPSGVKKPAIRGQK